MTPPNILYIHSHDTGRYVSPYGYAMQTPHIQHLAEEGILFRQAFCAGPTCSPSRAALLTGSYPHNNGMVGLAHRGSRLFDYSHHLAHYLTAHGYATALSGMQHEVDHRERHLLGYETDLDSMPVPGVTDKQEAVARRAVAFLEENKKQPFFLSCGFTVTHRLGKCFNETGEPCGDPRYCRPPAHIPDTPETRRDFADFSAAVTRLDTYIGIVLDTLNRTGLAENTLVICTTDHGIAFPQMKCNLTDHGLGVMLMLRGPGGFTGGTVVDAMVSHLDVFPTICDITRIPAPAWLQGASLCPLVQGSKDVIHDEIAAEVNYHAAAEPMRAIRTSRYKYIRRYATRNTPTLPNCDESITKDVFLHHGWQDRELPEESLFDLIYDPTEVVNLADSPAHQDVLHDMRQRLTNWMQQTDDPLLNGRVPIWPGMVLNSEDDPSPESPVHPAESLITPHEEFGVSVTG
ncbi:MAG TPA: sulfatase [Armatimonadota bacterium]|nr:sulfatase [Armatimonadota bacterium]